MATKKKTRATVKGLRWSAITNGLKAMQDSMNKKDKQATGVNNEKEQGT